MHRRFEARQATAALQGRRREPDGRTMPTTARPLTSTAARSSLQVAGQVAAAAATAAALGASDG